MNSADALDDLLAQAGVDIGRPERRRDRAVRLVNEGLTEADLAELVAWAHYTRRKVHTVGHWLGWATASIGRWQAVLADLRKLKAARAQHAPVERAAHQPNEMSPAEFADRLQVMAWCRVVADHADPNLVAQELRVTVERIDELVAAERVVRSARLGRLGQQRVHPVAVLKPQEETW